MKITNGKDFWAGVMFLGFGLGFMIVAINNYAMGSAVRMGPAYFPTMLGALCAILGAAVLLRAFFSKIKHPFKVFPFRLWFLVPAAVLGGFGSLPGAVVGGLVIGVIEELAGLYLPEGFKNVAAYVVLLAVLTRFLPSDDPRIRATVLAIVNAVGSSIAREADVSTATLYKHFTSKETLFTAVVKEAARGSGNYDGLITPQDSARDALYKICRSYLSAQFEDGAAALMRVVIAEVPGAPELARDMYEILGNRRSDSLMSAIGMLIEQGKLRPHDSAFSMRIGGGMLKEVFVWPALFDAEATLPPDTVVVVMEEVVVESGGKVVVTVAIVVVVVVVVVVGTTSLHSSFHQFSAILLSPATVRKTVLTISQARKIIIRP